jgi:hypothetical protein
MFELKEAANAVGIDVIGYRGTAELDGVRQDLLQSCVQSSEFEPGEFAGLLAWTNSCAE